MPTPSLELRLNQIDSNQQTPDTVGNLYATEGDPKVVLDDVFGRSMRFGSRQAAVRVDLPEPGGDGAFTIEAWVKRGPSTDPAPVISMCQDPGAWWMLRVGKHAEMVWPENERAVIWSIPRTAHPLAADEWTHLAVSFDGQLVKLYQDGQLTAQREGPLPWPGGPLRLGYCGDLLGHLNLVRPLPDTESQFYSCSFSSDGSTLLAPDYKGAKLWDAHSGEPRRGSGGEPIFLPQKGLNLAAFSPDDRMILTAGFETAQLWDAETGEPTTNPDGEPIQMGLGRSNGAGFSPDGSVVATCHRGGVRMWNAHTGEPLANGGFVIEDEHEIFAAIAFSPDGKAIYAGEYGGIRVWDAQTGEPRKGSDGEVIVMRGGLAALSPDGNIVVGRGDWDQTHKAYALYLYDAHTGEPRKGADGEAVVMYGQYAVTDGRIIATADSIASFRLYDARSGEPLVDDDGSNIEAETNRHATDGLGLSPDGQTIALGTRGDSELWDVAFLRRRRFQGNLAHVRFFQHARSEQEIQRGIQKDLPQVQVSGVFPLEFSLLNEQEQKVLYLGDDVRRTLHLTVRNVGQKDINLASRPTGDAASLELHFRPGTLKDADQIGVEPAGNGVAQWELQHENPPDRTDVLRLTRPLGESDQASDTLRPQEALRFKLVGVQPEEAGGSRTTLVQLKYRLRHSDGSPFTGSRLHFLSVLQRSESQIEKDLKGLDAKTEDLARQASVAEEQARRNLEDFHERVAGIEATLGEDVQRMVDTLKAEEAFIERVKAQADAERASIHALQERLESHEQQLKLFSNREVRACLVDPSTVLCDRYAVNSLTIRIDTTETVALHEDTAITIDLDPYDSQHQWGLADEAEWDGLPPGWTPQASATTLRLTNSDHSRLDPERNPLLVTCRFVCAAPPGMAYIFVGYKNVGDPKHDGRVLIPVLRSPVAPRSDRLTVAGGALDLVNRPRLGLHQRALTQLDGQAAPDVTLETTDDGDLIVASRGDVVLNPAGGKTQVQGSLNVSGTLDAGGHEVKAGNLQAHEVHAEAGVYGTGGYLVPAGGIILWHGSKDDIPHGWALCDGNWVDWKGKWVRAPNLTDRFVVGAGGSYPPNGPPGPPPETGRSSTGMTLHEQHIPRHTHSGKVNPQDHRHGLDAGPQRWGSASGGGYSVIRGGGAGEMSNTRLQVSIQHWGGTTWGTTTEFDIRPPYYALCYIMKL